VSADSELGLLTLALTTLELFQLLVVVAGAVLLISRPHALAVLTVGATILVNSGWLPVFPPSRFILLGALCGSLLIQGTITHTVRRLSWRACSMVLLALAVLLVDLAVHLSDRTSVLRNLSFQLLLFAAATIPGRIAEFRLEMMWKVIFRFLLLYLLIGTAVRFLVAPEATYSYGTLGLAFRGAMNNPNALGLLAGATLVYYVSASRPAWRGLLYAAPLAALIILSDSRGAALAVVAGISGNYLLRSDVRRFVTVCGLIVTTLLLGGRLIAQLATESRWLAWSLALRRAISRPFSGVGFGGTEDYLRGGGLRLPITFQGDQLHNAYVQLVFELGPVLAIALLTALSWLVILAMREQCLPSGLVALRPVILFGVVGALSESWMFSTGSVFAVIFWLAVGSLWPRRQAMTRSDPWPPQTAERLPSPADV
jgi:hypothetical protein